MITANMSENAASAEKELRDSLPEGGFVVSGGRGLFMEVMDSTSRTVWMSAAAVQPADFEKLELEPPLVKTGIGSAAMDHAAFRHSPGTPDEPVRQRMIDGHLFINVATPGAATQAVQPGGPMEIAVDKGHTLAFDAGRSLTLLKLPDGDFVEVVGDASGDASRVLPVGGTLKQIELTEPWVVPLPTPTRTFFWMGKSMRSFQGPVTVPRDAK